MSHFWYHHRCSRKLLGLTCLNMFDHFLIRCHHVHRGYQDWSSFNNLYLTSEKFLLNELQGCVSTNGRDSFEDPTPGKDRCHFITCSTFPGLFSASKRNLPVLWFAFKSSPQALDHRNIHNTQQLEEFDKLQRRILVNLDLIVGHQVVQSLDNLL